jgi:hypothetical protein
LTRLLLGLVKGLVVGAVIGLGAWALDLQGGFNWLTYGLVGAFVGLLVGRPIWSHLRDKQSTSWVAILKALVGYGIGVGIYAIVAKAWGGFSFAFQGETRNVVDWQPVFGGAVGAIYGAFVEIDDAIPSGGASTKSKSAPAKPASKPVGKPVSKK